ncbi:MAG: hypothetical protein PHS14_09505 [Elusimicrobia bacterium]|nr:hypothetical protein [Elusimicrobiota bacterium]
MITRCLGTWTDREHEPVVIGAKEPLSDTRISDGCCDRCCRLMQVPIECRLCGQAETAVGLCGSCEKRLQSQLGEPAYELEVFRAGFKSLSGQYDGAGVLLRLKTSMKDPAYCGFRLQALARSGA